MRVRFPKAPRSGERVLRLAGVAKAYGPTRVYGGLDLEIGRDERIVLIGPNGAGKSTLLRLAAGVLPPDAGVRELGHNVRVAFYAQHTLEALDPRQTVLGELERGATLDQIPQLRGLLGAFLFSGDDVEKRVSVLSGGEQARVALAKLLLERANFLVLDEPTNHLDIRAHDVLIDALRRFGGTLLFISHDRTFINSLATRVLEITPGADTAQVRSFPGNYDDYAYKLERLARAAPDAAPERHAKRHAAPAQPAPSPEPPPRSTRQARRNKATFTLRRLEDQAADLESSIIETEDEIERIGWLTADPSVARDGERMRDLQQQRQALQTHLDSLYTDWERLSAEIEALLDVQGR